MRDADRERQRLAERRYARGVTNYLEMLDAQRSLFESEQEFIRLQQRRLVNAVTLRGAGRLGTGFGRELSRVRARRVGASVPDPPRSSARLRKRHQSAALTR